MHMRNNRVRNARLKTSLKLDMESNFRNLSNELFLALFGPYLSTSSMKLVKRLEMVSSCSSFEDLGLILNAFEDQSDMGTLKSVAIEKIKEGDWRFLVTKRLSDGCDELVEHMHIEMELVFHWVIDGRFWIQSNISGKQQGVAMKAVYEFITQWSWAYI